MLYQYGCAFRSLMLKLLPIKFDGDGGIVVVVVVVAVAVSVLPSLDY